MKFTLTFILTVLFHVIKCYDSDSIESYNGIEVSPFYDAIIFSDIADIVNEFENNNIPITNFVKNESESDEEVDDLLSEYQNYLEKAHTQTKSYIEKSKLKNKVPLLRHDKYSKNKASGKKHDDYIYKADYFSPDLFKFPKSNSPLDLFLPINNKGKLFTINDHLPRSNYHYDSKLNTFNDIVVNEDKVLPSSLPKVPSKSTCYCKNNQLPCTCGCKQCLLKIDPPTFNHVGLKPYQPYEDDKKYFAENVFPINNMQDQQHVDSKVANFQDDTLNIRIKVDVQLPAALQRRLMKNQIHENPDFDGAMREFFPTVKIPTPFYNFPIPINNFGFKKPSKTYASPFHKISIHKKRRTKSNNSNKKHKKNMITFHNIKIEPQQLFEAELGKPNESIISKNITYAMNITTGSFTTASPPIIHTNVTTETMLLNSQNKTYNEEHLFLLVNISNNAGNGTDDIQAENSIETDFTNAIVNTTDKAIHLIKKREASNNNVTTPAASYKVNPSTKVSEVSTVHSPSSQHHSNAIKVHSTNKMAKRTKNEVTVSSKVSKVSSSHPSSQHQSNHTIPYHTIKGHSPTKVTKKSTNSKAGKEKKKSVRKSKKINRTTPNGIPSDEELFYWPVNKKSGSHSKNEYKNITKIILEHEHKKANINVAKEALRKNHTNMLEKAIFANVNWNDIDAVAPAFISFVGKYINGALTFCNNHICHSMKCEHKKCIYRVCKPSDRVNHKGHCNGTNSTESVITMESKMDLPLNAAFEIVDILKKRMVGKLFGKATLCIKSTCITFVASNKNILKGNCVVKKLNKGHCKITQKVKVN